MKSVMKKPKDIRQFKADELKDFLGSFDIIMADCDGVLWLNESPIPGALKTLKMLQHMGKKVVFVSNNNTRSMEDYLTKFRKMGFEATPEQIIFPSLAIVWYLKNINFYGQALTIGTKPFIKVLTDGGIDVITGPDYVEEDMATVRNIMKDQPEVKAVIIDFDVNINWAKMIQVSELLEREDVLFLTGPRDERVPVSATKSIIGPGPFIDILIKHTGRIPIKYAKPSDILKNYLFERYEIKNPEKCIFVGDSMAVDMKFAALCGFSKLWVSSGIDKADLLNGICDVMPDYYLPNLGMMPLGIIEQ